MYIVLFLKYTIKVLKFTGRLLETTTLSVFFFFFQQLVDTKLLLLLYSWDGLAQLLYKWQIYHIISDLEKKKTVKKKPHIITTKRKKTQKTHGWMNLIKYTKSDTDI